MVGVGPGAFKLLTQAAQDAIRDAELVVGWKLSLDLVEPLLGGKDVLVEEAGNYPEIIREAAARCTKEEKTTAVLTTGDPCVSAALEEIVGAFDGAAVQVVPGISSVQMAAGRAGVSLEECVVVSFHKLGDVQGRLGWMRDALNRGRHAIALVDEAYPPSWIAKNLMAERIPTSAAALVCQRVSLPDEVVFRGTLGEVGRGAFDPLSVLVVLAPEGGP